MPSERKMGMGRVRGQLTRGESGNALPFALILLVMGSLWLLPSVTYATVNLNNHRIIDSHMKGTYAAEAGVENALWYLKNGQQVPAQPITVNGMNVTTQVTGNGTYTLYLNEMVGTTHSDYLTITSS